MSPKKITAILIAIFFVFLSGVYSESGKKLFADLVIKNAKIVTIDKDNPRAQAVAIKGEFIIAVASNSKIKKYIKNRETQVRILEREH